MKYKFTVKYKNKCYSEEYSTDSIDSEWLENYDNSEVCQAVITWDRIAELNGKHILFGCIESLEQSDNCPNWLHGVDKERVILDWSYV